MADTWKTLLEAAQADKAVAVTLSPGARIMRPKRRRGRPRVRGAAPFGHYAGYREDKGARPRCALWGCGKRLKRDQRIACCPEHETKAVAAAKALLEKVA